MITPEQLQKANEIREEARRDMAAVVAATQESLAYTPPESRGEPHLSRLATRCVQIGIDMATALNAIGITR